MCIKKLLTFFIFLLAFSSVSLAQDSHLNDDTSKSEIEEIYDTSLEELMNLKVTSPSKRSENFFDAPNSISIITENDIRLFGANNLTELLIRATNVLPFYSLLSANSALSMRGDKISVSQNHVLVLLNGNPIGRESYLNTWNQALYSSFPISIIDRIEIVRGPGSVLYGTNAFTGILNIITKKGAKDRVHIEARGGTFNTKAGETYVNFENSESGFKINTALKYFDTDGWPFSANRLQGTTVVGATGNVFEHDNTGFVTNLEYKNLQINGFLGYTHQFDMRAANTLPTSLINRKYVVDVGYTIPYSKNWKSVFNITQLWGVTDLELAPSGIVTVGGVNHYTTQDTRIEGTVYGTLSKDLELLVGAVTNRINGRLTSSAVGVSSFGWNQFWLGGYAELAYQITQALKLNAGGQLNKIPNVDANFVPRLGAVYNFTPEVGVKLLYDQAFRSAVGGDAIPEFFVYPLRPEKIRTTEFQAFYHTQKTQNAITLFHAKQSDLITRVSNPALYGKNTAFVNQAELTSMGLEFETKYLAIPRIYLIGSYTYQHNSDDLDRVNGALAPSHQLKTGVAYTKTPLTVGVFNSYITAFQDNVIVSSARRAINPNSKNFDLLSANLSLSANDIFHLSPKSPQFKLDVYMTNLLDSDIFVPDVSTGVVNTIPGGPGRAVYFKVSADL